MMIKAAFSNAVCEKIGYYVYILKNPISQSIFYVGKGKGNRLFEHLNCALEDFSDSIKYNIIREIITNGFQVEHYILRHGLTEEMALEIESACIDLLGLGNLTNKVVGHNTWERGMKNIDEIIQFYDSRQIIIEEPAIIININRQYKRHMSAEELYNATKHRWKVGVKRNDAKYAIASFNGLVREIYKIESWNKWEDGRYEFFGKIADDDIRDKYINQSLELYIKKGSQNPIKYCGLF
ncbi:MAG: hypothetical protein V4687_06805 [Bacteroidota bacterium]